jgi:peroxiredoxin
MKTPISLCLVLILAATIRADDAAKPKVPASLDAANTVAEISAYIKHVNGELLKEFKIKDDTPTEERIPCLKKLAPIRLAGAEKILSIAKTDEERKTGYEQKIVAFIVFCSAQPKNQELPYKLRDLGNEVEKEGKFPDLATKYKILSFWQRTGGVDTTTLTREEFEKIKKEGKQIAAIDTNKWITDDGLTIPLTIASQMPLAKSDPQFLSSTLDEMCRFVDSGKHHFRKPEYVKHELTTLHRRLPGAPFEAKGETVDGKPFDMNDYKGKYVLVEFTFAACGPCREQSPYLRESYGKYREKGFEIVSIGSDTPENLKKMIDEDKIIWTMVWDDPKKGKIGEYPNGPLCEYYGVPGFPTILLIGPDGKIIRDDLYHEKIRSELSKLFDK